MNDDPRADAVSLSTAEDTAGQVVLIGSDVDGDTLTYSLASQPAHGGAGAEGNRVTYTPAPNYSGSDSFAYVVSDGKGGSAGAVVSIQVSPVNDAPTSVEQNESMPEDMSRAIRLAGGDADGDSLTYEILDQPTRGALTGSGADRTYTPAADYSGPDWFTYVVSDGRLRSSAATVRLTVLPVNDAPTCSDASLTTDEDVAVESAAVCTDVDGGALVYSIVRAPSNGTASFVGGKLRYVPNRDVHGADSLTYRVSDPTLVSNVATATLTVNSVNDAPVAASVDASVLEDGATDVAFSGTDAEGDSLSYEIVAGPANGSLTGTGASRTYTPAANFNGSDSFTYRVSDGVASSGAATVTLSVEGVNDAPTCAGVVLATDEDAAAERDPDCLDVEGDALTYSIVSGAAKGTASVAAGRLRYVPDANANGEDAFTYRAADGSSASAAADVSVSVAAVNDAPVAEGAAVTASEDAEKALTLAASDLEGDSLEYEVVSGPEHGTLTGAGAGRTYTPAPNYHGPDAFTFRARDGALASSVATVNITVQPANDAPVCVAQSMSLDEDASGAVEPACTDVDGDALTLEIVDQSVKGSASIVAGKLRYVPNANANGADSFTYRAGDGVLASAVATVSVTIAPVNDTPACAGQTLATDEDVAAQLDPVCTDIEGDALTYLVGGAANGTAAIVAGRLRYTPDADFNGSDSFTYRASDGRADSNFATVAVTVAAVNDAPTATGQAATTAEDTEKALTLRADDVDGDALTYEIVAGPTDGTLAGEGAERTYAPGANFNGSDSFTYRVSDGVATSGVALVTLSVGAVNDAPTCAGVVLATDEDVAAERDPDCADVDGDALTYEIVGAAAKGTASVAAGRLRYVPDANANGEDGFTYRAADGSTASAAVDVSVSVAAVNDAPVAEGAALTATEDEAQAVTLAASDLEGDSLEYEVVSGPEHGTLTGDGAAWTYAPALNYHGPDAFTFRVRDGALDSNVATVSITVDPVNDAPVADGLAVTTSEDVATELVLPAADVDEDDLTYTLVSDPAHGTLSGTGADRAYTPESNFHGSDSFTYLVGDGTAQSEVATVSITVDPVNDPPSSASQEAMTPEDTPTALTLSGADIDGDALSYEIIASPEHGELSGSGADRTYTPAEHYHGPDSFTYKVSDGAAESEVATVTLAVESVNDAPTAAGLDAATTEDTAKALTLDSADADGDPLAFEIVSGPAHGDLSGTGSDRTYTPHPDYNGSDEFTYTVSDGSASSALATVSLSVAEVNDSPSAAADGAETAEDTELAISAATLLGNDGSGPPNEASQSLTLTGVGSAEGGTVAYDSAAGEVRFAPDQHFHGTASFTYAIEDDGQTDGAADPKTAEGTVTVHVSSVNDEPVAADGEQTTNEDEPVTLALAASDADGDALQFTIEAQPLHGEVTLAGAQVTYTPAPDYWGPDSFTFVASDGSSSSSAAISIDVASINDAPALDTSGTPELTPVKQDASEPAGDTVAEILASGAAGDQVITDVDGDPSGIAVFSVDGSGGTWEYRTVGGSWTSLDSIDASAARLLDLDSRMRFVPPAGFSGEAIVRFRAWDGSVGAVGGTADATVAGGRSAFSADYEEAAITVIPNVAPVAVDDTTTTTEDNEVRVDVLANDSDADGEPLTVAVETQPDAGSATLVDGAIQYRPDPDKNGTDRFTYTVRDPRGGVATGTVDVTVTAVNDLPITGDDTETVAEDGIVVFDPMGNDSAGPLDESSGALSLRAITSPAQHGAAAVTGGKVRYTPTPGYAGSDLLTYEVCDNGTPALCSEANVTLTISRVSASVETDPVPHAQEQNPNGSMKVIDAADDPAIWVNPVDPAQSLIIGTSKYADETTNGGLLVYDLDGNQLFYTNDGTKNNVDLRSGFPLGGREVTLVTASQRNDPPQPKRVVIYTLDPTTKSLTHAGEFTPLFEPLGDCMYRSATTGHFYVFVVSANGWVQQWRLAEASGGTGAISATEVRLFRVSAVGAPDIAEGCVADDGLGHFYVSEEEVGIWKYSAEPDGGETRTQVDAVGAGQLTADVEGLAIAYGSGGTGYLIASSQGTGSFAVYRRDGDNAFVRSFKIKDGAVDGTTITDGIGVTTAPLGPAFPNGMFVAQDNNNTPDNQNFKLVPLERIFPAASPGSGAEPVGAGGAALAAGALWLGLAAIARRRRRGVPSSGR